MIELGSIWVSQTFFILFIYLLIFSPPQSMVDLDQTAPDLHSASTLLSTAHGSDMGLFTQVQMVLKFQWNFTQISKI